MKKLKIFENSNSGDVVYIQQNTLWVSYNPGSGKTTQIAGDPDKFRGFWSSDSNDSHYDSNVENIEKWAETQEGVKVKDGCTLHRIPCYWGYGKEARDLSVWGGDVKPDYLIWLALIKTPNYSLVHLFRTKTEAIGFIK